jgi:hypothetical protein
VKHEILAAISVDILEVTLLMSLWFHAAMICYRVGGNDKAAEYLERVSIQPGPFPAVPASRKQR